MNLLRIILITSILVFSQVSCKQEQQESEIEAKVIDYRVEYIDKTAGSIPTKILPKKMELILFENFAMNTIEGFLGQFSLTYIANLRKEKVTTLLKIFDKKYYYAGKRNELPCGISGMDGMTLIKTGNNKNILDFAAIEYKMEIPGGMKLLVYGTNGIKVKSPNRATPYREIDEVLLQFYTRLSVLEMILTAEDYREEILSTNILRIPEGYKEISRIQMEKTISELFK